MRNIKTFQRSIAGALVLLMILGAFSFGVFASADTVAVTASLSEDGFIYPPSELEISDGLAEEYGYTVQDASGPTVFDAAVALHKEVFGDAFTPETAKDFLDITSSGFLTKLLGQETSAIGFMVNGRTPNDGVYNESYGSYTSYTADMSVLSAGDNVQIFLYQDKSFWSDEYSYFDKTELTAKTNEQFSLTLSGFSTFYGTYPEDIISAATHSFEDMTILVSSDKNFENADEYVTDENGAATLSFDTEGTYYITAASDPEYYIYITPPWCVVTVSDQKDSDPAESQAPVESQTPAETPSAAPEVSPSASPSATDAPSSSPSAGFTTSEITEKIAALSKNISDDYADETEDAWKIIDMAAAGYADKLNQKDKYIAATIDACASDKSSDFSYLVKAALSLTALDVDATGLTASDGTEFNLIERISGFAAEDIGYSANAIYALSAYDCGDFAVDTGLTRDALIDVILKSRASNGLWGYSYGGQEFIDYDTTASTLSAFAPYYLAEDAQAAGISEEHYTQIQDSVNTVIDALSEAQGENGSLGSSNTDAMTVIGLASVGINPNTNPQFIKSQSLMSALMGYALEDNSGFGFSDNSTYNALATEQAFRAMIAYQGIYDTNAAYNIYMLIPVTMPETGAGSGGGSSNPGGGGSSSSQIRVTFTLRGDTVHGNGAHSGSYPVWISESSYTLTQGATALDLFKKVMSANGYTYKLSGGSYITSITSPSGVTLEEFSNGPYSGWLYEVNGEQPQVSMGDYTLKNGDEMDFYFTDDYRESYDPGTGSTGSGGSNGSLGFGGSGFGSGSSSSSPSPSAAPEGENETPAGSSSFSDVPEEHWAYEYISELTSKGVVNGYDDGSFRPDANVTRAEFVTILYRAAGASDTASTAETEISFDDVTPGDWYYEYAIWAAGAGITNGTSETEFSPDENIIRQDICVMLDRYSTNIAASPLTIAENAGAFADDGEISDYAKDSVYKLKSAGIVSGTGDNRFEPQSGATRAETCKMVLGIVE